MKRRIVIQGNSTYTISLPRKWAVRHNLKNGDEVEVEETENQVIIAKNAAEAVKEKKISIDNYTSSHLRSLISSLYKSGYTKITLTYKIAPDMNDVNKIISSFTGLEIVEQKKNAIVIKSFLTINQEEIEKLIIRMFQSVNVLGKQVEEQGKKADLSQIKSVAKGTMLKLRDHILRSIYMTKFGEDNTYNYYEIITILEKISAEFYNTAEHIVEHNIKDLTNFSTKRVFFEELYKVYLKKDYAMMEKSWKKIHKIRLDYAGKTVKFNPLLKIHCYRLSKLLTQLNSRIGILCS